MSVVVGVPTLNGPERLERCLISIKECTNLDGVKVVVCDDGSTEELVGRNADAVQRVNVPNCEFIRNDARKGIAFSWNRLTRHYGDAEVVALINDDVEVVDDWLDVLVFSVRNNPSLGMVGLNSYVALTKQQVAQLHPDALPHERSPRIDYHESRLLDGGGTLLSSLGPCFAFGREAYEMVGGFDERYFCFYEELSFGVALRKLGLFSFMADYPVVYHLGGATNSDKFNLDAQDHMRRSREAFIQQWDATPAQLRETFRADYVRPVLREWNTNIRSWQ